jgi:hypothetical protein
MRHRLLRVELGRSQRFAKMPWERSTGPVTVTGKAKVSRNGYKGGTRTALRTLAKLVHD